MNLSTQARGQPNSLPVAVVAEFIHAWNSSNDPADDDATRRLIRAQDALRDAMNAKARAVILEYI